MLDSMYAMRDSLYATTSLHTLHKSILTGSGIEDMDIDRRRNGIRGFARVVAIVTLVGLLELEDARAPPLLHGDARVVVDHTLFVVPEHELGGFGGVTQSAHEPQEGAGTQVEIGGALDLRQGRWKKKKIENVIFSSILTFSR